MTSTVIAVVFKEMGAQNMRDTVTVELYKSGTMVSDTYTASIEGAAKIMVGEGKYIDLLNAMMTYGDSAKAYMDLANQ